MGSLPDMGQLPPNTLNGVVAVAIAVGTLYCFLGYRVFRFVLASTGFILAGAVAAGLGAWLSQGNPWAALGAGAAGGVCGAFALAFVYKAGVFLVGVLAALLVAMSVSVETAAAWVPWAILGAGVGGGLLAVVIERPIMTCATAAIGAWMVVFGVLFFLAGPETLPQGPERVLSDQDGWAVMACWGVLAAGGALAQFATYRKRVVREPRE